ncbi:cytochrome c oxidase subunit II [Clavibacter michiganensis]|uniref:hypothetical protein n=1 Tax=Clavibacter michiganensis TaxID=28447 RepID=UPI00374E0569
MSGKTNYMTFIPEKEGTYMGKCPELCGEYHPLMLSQVKVVPVDEYTAYIESQKAAGFEASPRGAGSHPIGLALAEALLGGGGARGGRLDPRKGPRHDGRQPPPRPLPPRRPWSSRRRRSLVRRSSWPTTSSAPPRPQRPTITSSAALPSV